MPDFVEVDDEHFSNSNLFANDVYIVEVVYIPRERKSNFF